MTTTRYALPLSLSLAACALDRSDQTSTTSTTTTTTCLPVFDPQPADFANVGLCSIP
jgi:hypothetical protein